MVCENENMTKWFTIPIAFHQIRVINSSEVGMVNIKKALIMDLSNIVFPKK